MFLSQIYYNNTDQSLVQNVLFVRIHYAMKIDKYMYKQKLKRNNKETKTLKVNATFYGGVNKKNITYLEIS